MTETTPQPAAKNVRANDNDGVLTAAHFVLEKFCKQALESNTRGPAELTKLATSFGINRSYRTLINALNKYKSSGLLRLKEKNIQAKVNRALFLNLLSSFFSAITSVLLL